MKASHQATREVASTLGILVGLAGIDHGIFEILQGQLTPTSLLIAFVIIFVFSVIVAIFGWPLTIFFDDETAFEHLNTLSLIMVGMMLLAVVSGFAYDIQAQIQSELKTHEG